MTPIPDAAEPIDVRPLATELLAAHDRTGERVLLGVAGVPGAGKTTFAEYLVAELGAQRPGSAVQVPMDGFHLARCVIAGDERAARRGAPDTFDPWGYCRLLERLRLRNEPVVHAPAFDRTVGDPVAGAIAVPRDVRVVVTEGNYLLLPDPAWRAVRAQLDAVWFIEAPDDDLRRTRLVERHERFGKDAEHARRHVFGVDEANAALVRASADAADRRLRWRHW